MKIQSHFMVMHTLCQELCAEENKRKEIASNVSLSSNMWEESHEMVGSTVEH